MEKLYYSIGEVAAMFKINQSTLRFWEKEFKEIKPHKNKKGNRKYRKEDIEIIRLIFHLLKEKKMTIDGAKMKMKHNYEEETKKMEVINRLESVKSQLLEIKKELTN